MLNKEVVGIEIKMNEMASKILNGDSLKSFLELPIDGKVAGIGFFASMSGDREVVDMCSYAMRVLG